MLDGFLHLLDATMTHNRKELVEVFFLEDTQKYSIPSCSPEIRGSTVVPKQITNLIHPGVQTQSLCFRLNSKRLARAKSHYPIAMRICPKCFREFAESVVFCPHDGALVLNTILNQKYRLDEMLNEGGMGVIYRGTHLDLNKKVAVKIMLPRYIPDETSRKRFIREARYTADLQHPNIIQVFDLEEEQGITYFVMELLEGMDLRRQIQLRGRMTLNEISNILNQVCLGVQAAHMKGILHRDLKPANIFLAQTEDGLELVKVLDFGIAKLVANETQSLTADGVTIGTPEYISPEHASDEMVDARSDVYSLGVILYEMLTGQVPFRGSMPAVTLVKHITEQPTSLQKLCPEIPTAVEEVVLRALEKKPEHRQQSTMQLAEEFAAAIRKDSWLYPEIHVETYEFETILIESTGVVADQRQKKVRFFVETMGEGVDLEMVYIPSGTFLLGSPRTESGRSRDEGPQHQVTVSPFFLGKYPVTQVQWRTVAHFPKVKRDLKPDPSYFKGDQLPVEQISWHDGVEFCARLSALTGKLYRFPTEAEWEYACRAGTTTPFHFGETIVTDFVNYNGSSSLNYNPKKKHRSQTSPVGSLGIANGFGLYDMHGNVWEWCQDWYGPYRDDPITNPKGPESGTGKINRGGSWFSLAVYCRSANRGHLSPGTRISYLGLRIVAEMK